MKHKIISVTALFALIITCLTAAVYFSDQSISTEDTQAQYIVALNEVEQLTKMGNHELAAQKLNALQETMRNSVLIRSDGYRALIIGAVSLIFLLIVFGYIYFSVIRPFDKLKDFANKIAAGNFDVPLQYERNNEIVNIT